MNLLSTILLYGLVLTALVCVVLFAIGLVNPRSMLQKYPKDIQAAVPPKTAAEKRQMFYWLVPLFGSMVGCPTLAAVVIKASDTSFLALFLAAFGVIFLFNLIDWLILDWLVFCTITPTFLVLAGTEGMAGYKDYAMHFRGFLHGTVFSGVLGFIIAGIIWFL